MRSIFTALTELGLTEAEDLQEDDIVTDVVIIFRTQKLTDTKDAIVLEASEQSGGVVVAGMIHSAGVLHDSWMVEGKDNDE